MATGAADRERHGGFNYPWTRQDPDTANSLVRVCLDPDRVHDNGDEVLVSTSTASTGTGNLTAFPGGVKTRLHYVAIEAANSLNTVDPIQADRCECCRSST